MEGTTGRMNVRQRENKKKKVGLLPGVTSYGSNTFQQSIVYVCLTGRDSPDVCL